MLNKIFTMKRNRTQAFDITAFRGDDESIARPQMNLVFDKYYPRICMLAYRLLGSTKEQQPIAEQIAQNALETLWTIRQKDQCKSKKYIHAFLYIAAKNAVYNILKETISDQKEWDDRVVNAMARAEVLGEVHQTLEALPPECQKVARLALVDGLSNEQIAETLQLSEQTVIEQRKRAREFMSEAFLDKDKDKADWISDDHADDDIVELIIMGPPHADHIPDMIYAVELALRLSKLPKTRSEALLALFKESAFDAAITAALAPAQEADTVQENEAIPYLDVLRNNIATLTEAQQSVLLGLYRDNKTQEMLATESDSSEDDIALQKNLALWELKLGVTKSCLALDGLRIA
jgi:RNA polymerase sigma factor (sigma-70 family)